MSIGLLLGTCRRKSIPFNNVVRLWTGGLVKMFGVWFDLDLQIEKNLSEVTTLTQTSSGRALSLLEEAEIAQTSIVSVITFRLIAVLCPDL